MTTTPLPSTSEGKSCNPESEVPALRYRPQLETSTHSVATEEGASEYDPGERSAPGMPCGSELLPHPRRRRQKEKELVRKIWEPDSPRVCWIHPLSDGVYQHPKILSPAPRFKV